MRAARPGHGIFCPFQRLPKRAVYADGKNTRSYRLRASTRIVIYIYISHFPIYSFLSFFLPRLDYLPSSKKKDHRAIPEEKGKVKANNHGRRRRRRGEKGKQASDGGFPRRGFGSCRSNQSRIVGHMARERAACVGVACQAFLRAARKLVTSSSACVSGQSRPDYLTPGRAYVATPSPPPNRLLLSQLTPGQIKPSITIAYKNPFYSPAFLPFLARQVVPGFSTRVSQRVLFLSFFFFQQNPISLRDEERFGKIGRFVMNL